MPVTVFTLRDTPSNDGHGPICLLSPKIGSLLLQTIAVSLKSGGYLSEGCKYHVRGACRVFAGYRGCKFVMRIESLRAIVVVRSTTPPSAPCL